MPETQHDIDALLAEVNALAEEAVATIGHDDPSPNEEKGSTPVTAKMGGSPHASTTKAVRSPVSPLVKHGRIAANPAVEGQEKVSRILTIEVPIIVQLSERTMTLSEILKLTTGAIIEFDKPADSELELKVNNKCIGSGQAVKVGENFGLRVVRIGSIRERIQALGGT